MQRSMVLCSANRHLNALWTCACETGTMADIIVRDEGTGPSRKSGREVWVTRRPLWLYTARPRGPLDVGPPGA